MIFLYLTFLNLYDEIDNMISNNNIIIINYYLFIIIIFLICQLKYIIHESQ